MTPPPVAPRPVAPAWTVAAPWGLLALAVVSAALSWQDGDAAFLAFSALALALDVAVIVTAVAGRRLARSIGAAPSDTTIGALILAALMLVGFVLMMVVLATKPIVK